MSYRRMMYVPLLLLLLTTVGCATFPPIKDGSPDEMNQAKSPDKEKVAYQKRLADQQEEIARMAKDLSDQQTEIAQTDKQVAELNKSVDELNTQMRQFQEARQKEHPLKETELAPMKKGAMTDKKIKGAKKEVRKAAPAAREQEPKSTDTSAIMKQITDAKQKLTPGKEESEKPQKKKDAEMPREKITETKQETQPEAPEVKAREPKPLDDLSIQMKQFEEAEQRGSSAKETGSVQVKKGAVKEDKAVKAPKQIARKEPAEMKTPQQKTLKIKVLAGDGNIASARSLSKRLGKMGYRVKAIDQAPRSDFDATVVYYGNEHRAAAETMAKKLGGGAVTRPLTWSSAFDIIVVTGRQP